MTEPVVAGAVTSDRRDSRSRGLAQSPGIGTARRLESNHAGMAELVDAGDLKDRNGLIEGLLSLAKELQEPSNWKNFRDALPTRPDEAERRVVMGFASEFAPESRHDELAETTAALHLLDRTVTLVQPFSTRPLTCNDAR